MTEVNLNTLAGFDVAGMVNVPGQASAVYSELEKQLKKQIVDIKALAESARDSTLLAAEDMKNAALQQVNLAKDKAEKSLALLADLNKLDPTALLS